MTAIVICRRCSRSRRVPIERFEKGRRLRCGGCGSLDVLQTARGHRRMLERFAMFAEMKRVRVAEIRKRLEELPHSERRERARFKRAYQLRLA